LISKDYLSGTCSDFWSSTWY